MSEEQLWISWRDSPTDATRNSLILHYEPFVQHIARRVSAELPASVDRQDLASEGRFALFSCIERYDPDKGVTFVNFAGRRVEGSMKDWLRREDILPTRLRQTISPVQRALETASSGPMTWPERADSLGSTLEHLELASHGTAGVLQDIARERLVCLECDTSCLLVLDHDGLFVVVSPGIWRPIELSSVISFGEPTPIPLPSVRQDVPVRYYEQLRLSPDHAYEWHQASVTEECFLSLPAPYKELTMSHVLDRLDMKIERKTSELARLQAMRDAMVDPLISDDVADLLSLLPEDEDQTRQRSGIRVQIVTFLQNTDGAASVMEIARHLGKSNDQVRKCIKRAGPLIEQCSQSSNGVLRFRVPKPTLP